MNGVVTYDSTPINVYRAPPSENTTGWIVLSLILMAVIILFICLWAFSATQTCPPANSCSGTYGTSANLDAAPINGCGSSRNEPCSFPIASYSAAVTECDSLGARCPAFTYNSTTATMRIVEPTNTYTSAGTNIHVKQNCDIPQ